MDKRDIYLWLKSISGISTKTIEKIVNQLDDITKIFDISESEIYNLKNINLNIKENIVKYRSHSYLDNIKEKLYKLNIDYICIEDDLYPNKLKNIHNSPYLLYYKGNIKIADEFTIAMVGSRKPTRYGIECAKSISQKLSDKNINIVSGLAIGIDSYSHIGCMNSTAKTIAVLGSSVDNPLPKQNKGLYENILDNGGLVLSEYNVDSRVFPSNFVNRNRIISGISDGVIVVEAARKSGSLITADFGLDQGKNVFAVPGSIYSDMSKGCHSIINQGAKLIEDAEDVLNEYSFDKKLSKQLNFEIKKENEIFLSNKEQSIIDVLKNNGNLHSDKIYDSLKYDVSEVNSLLMQLELKNLVKEIKSNIYSLI